VVWENLSKISYVIGAYEQALNHYKDVQNPSREIKVKIHSKCMCLHEYLRRVQLKIGVCKLRLAFWNMAQAAHVSAGGSVASGDGGVGFIF
jgi:hypothetical protein